MLSAAILPGAVGGLLGGGLGLAANYARHRWDLHSRKVDHFCNDVVAVADASTDYWLSAIETPIMDAGQRLRPDGQLLSEAEGASAKAASLVELKLTGAQTRILLSGILVRDKLIVPDANRYDELVAALFMAATGGSFRDRDGSIEEKQAAAVQGAAADLVSHVRSASEQYYTLRRAVGLDWLLARGRAGWMRYGFPRKF